MLMNNTTQRMKSMRNLFDLSGKTAIITGSTRGIGKAIAEAYAAHGAKVVISSRKADVCDQVAKDIQDAHGADAAFPFPCNISDTERMQAMVDACMDRWGKIDILVANAAINPTFGPSKDVDDEVFMKIMSSNVVAAHRLSHMVLPQMVARKEGVVIMVSSIAGVQGNPVIGAYGVSKAADMQLVRNLAVEYGPHGIRVNAIAPGLVKTDFARALWENPEILEQTTKTIPLRRIGEPEEIAGMAVYFASPAGSFTTGMSYVVDGGMTIAWS